MGVIDAVFADGPAADAVNHRLKINRLKMHDADDINVFLQDLGLNAVSRNAVEDQQVFVGLEVREHAEPVEMPFPDADGDLIGDEHSLGGEAADLTTFGRVDVERAEDVATREVIEAGDLAQDSPLRSFANAWRTEQQHRMEAVGRHGLQHTNTGDEGGQTRDCVPRARW